MQGSTGLSTRNGARNMRAPDAKAVGSDFTRESLEHSRAAEWTTCADLVVVHGHIQLVLELERLIPEHTPEPEHVATVHLLHLQGHVQDVGTAAERAHVLACGEPGAAAEPKCTPLARSWPRSRTRRPLEKLRPPKVSQSACLCSEAAQPPSRGRWGEGEAQKASGPEINGAFPQNPSKRDPSPGSWNRGGWGGLGPPGAGLSL